MVTYKEKEYRKRIEPEGLISFHVIIKETDLWVSADRELEKETRDITFNYRRQIETYIKSHPNFLTTLLPYPEDPYAPPIVKEMIHTAKDIGIGPMASVAGAIAQFAAKDLLEHSDQVIVENGGDIFLKVTRPATVSIFAGESPLSEKIGIQISTGQMPLGVCSSSGTVGHSLSLGVADVVTLLAPSSAILADGAATALGNLVKNQNDLKTIAAQAAKITGISGGVAIMGDRMTAWGEVKLVRL